MTDSAKLDFIIEKMNLSRLDTLVLSGMFIPLSITTVGIIINSFLNPLPFRTASILAIAVQFLLGTLFLPLLLYAHGFISGTLETRIRALKMSLYWAFFGIAVICGLGYIYLHLVLTSRYVVYQQLIAISSAVVILSSPMAGWLVIFVVASVFFRRLSRWLYSQIPKRIEREGLNVNDLLRPLFPLSPAMFKVGVVCAAIGTSLVSILWYLTFPIFEAGELWWAYFFMDFVAGIVLASVFIVRGHDLFSYFQRNGHLAVEPSQTTSSRKSGLSKLN